MMGHAENKRQRQKEIELRLVHSLEGIVPGELVHALPVNRSTIHGDLIEISSRVELFRTDDGRYTINPATYIGSVRLSRAEALTIYIA